MTTTLTVVVLDENSQPTPGAQVTIKPSDAVAVTNSSGEVQFTLGTAIKYDITATAGSDTVTVPYYVTKNGATRLVVNPKHVKIVEQQLHPTPWYFSGPFLTISITLVVVIAFVIFWKFFWHKK